MTVKFRKATAADIDPFVVNGWLTSFRTAHAAGLVLMSAWRDVMWSTIERIIARPYVTTLVADDDGTLYGFLTYEGPSPRAAWRPDGGSSLDGLPYVYYAYTKEFRRRGRRTFGVGIMAGLLEAAGIDVTKPFGFACKTPSVVRLLDGGRIPGARWDPLRARYDREFAIEKRTA